MDRAFKSVRRADDCDKRGVELWEVGEQSMEGDLARSDEARASIEDGRLLLVA